MTLDPKSWGSFHNLFTSAGHHIVMVTGHKEEWSSDMARYDLSPTLPIVYTVGAMNEQAALKVSWKVDVWIDDMPSMIQERALLQPSLDASPWPVSPPRRPPLPL